MLLVPIDYTTIIQELSFNQSNTQREVRIPITDDDIVENVERFLGQLTLVTTGVMVQLSPQETEILINDNDSKYKCDCINMFIIILYNYIMQGVVIGLEETSYTTPESGTVEVCASLLQGQLERNAEVVLSTQDGEAIGLLWFILQRQMQHVMITGSCQ